MHPLLRYLAAAVASLVPSIGSAAENGVFPKEILIGQFAAQTGPAAELGKRMQIGVSAYINAVNAAGGVHGRKLKLVTRDDGYEPDRAAAAVKALIKEDKVFALVGSVGTPTTLAAVPAINEENIPLIGPFTGAQSPREPFNVNRNIFHVCASYYDETDRIVEHLTTLGINRIGVFYQNDSYGRAGLEGVERALKRRKLQTAGTATRRARLPQEHDQHRSGGIRVHQPRGLSRGARAR